MGWFFLEWFSAPKLGHVNTVLDEFFVRPENFTWQFVHTEIVKYFLFIHPRETCEPIWILTSHVPSRRRWFRMCVTCQKKLFRPFGRPVGLKIRGWGGEGRGGAGRAPPLDPPLIICLTLAVHVKVPQYDEMNFAQGQMCICHKWNQCVSWTQKKTNQNKALLWEKIL